MSPTLCYSKLNSWHLVSDLLLLIQLLVNILGKAVKDGSIGWSSATHVGEPPKWNFMPSTSAWHRGDGWNHLRNEPTDIVFVSASPFSPSPYWIFTHPAAALLHSGWENDTFHVIWIPSKPINSWFRWFSYSFSCSTLQLFPVGQARLNTAEAFIKLVS